MLGSMYLYFTIFLKLKTWQYPNCGWKIESQARSSISVQLSTGFKTLYNFNSIKSDLGEDNFVIRSVWLIFGLWSKKWSLYALDSWVVRWIKWLNSKNSSYRVATCFSKIYIVCTPKRPWLLTWQGFMLTQTLQAAFLMKKMSHYPKLTYCVLWWKTF